MVICDTASSPPLGWSAMKGPCGFQLHPGIFWNYWSAFACEPPQMWLKNYSDCCRLLRACLSLSCLAIHSLPFFRILFAKESPNVAELKGPCVISSLGLAVWKFCLQEVHESSISNNQLQYCRKVGGQLSKCNPHAIVHWFGLLAHRASSIVLVLFHWSHAWIASYSCLKVEKQSVNLTNITDCQKKLEAFIPVE